MASTSRQNSKGGKNIGKDVKFKPGDSIDMEVIVDVKDNPLHIFGRLPEGHTVSVYRIYNGENECVDAPDIPVMCKDGCSPLMLFNEANPECSNGRFIQDDIWLFYQGRYKLVYNTNDQTAIIPEDVYVWCMEDTLVSKIGINLPLCGENACPPECTPEHAMQLEGDSTPTAPPDCLRCESPVAFYDPMDTEGDLCDLALYFWSKSPMSTCSDDGEWKGINFAEWLNALGGLIKTVEIAEGGTITGSVDLEPISGDCVGRALTLNLNLGCPEPTIDTEIATQGDGSYSSTRQVWICENGSPALSTLTLKCPVESGVISIEPEGSEMRSDRSVWTCDVDGNPVRSDLILTCPVTETGITLSDTPSQDLFWVCQPDGTIVKKPVDIPSQPSICELLDDVPNSGINIPLGFGDAFNAVGKDCVERTYELPELPDTPEGCECTEFEANVFAGGNCFDLTPSNDDDILFKVNDDIAAPYIRNIVGTSSVAGSPFLDDGAMTYTNTNTYDVWVEMRYDFAMIIRNLLRARSAAYEHVYQSLTAISGSGALPLDPIYQISSGGPLNTVQDIAVANLGGARNMDLVGSTDSWSMGYTKERTKTVHRVAPGDSITTTIALFYAAHGVAGIAPDTEFIHIDVQGSFFAWGAK